MFHFNEPMSLSGLWVALVTVGVQSHPIDLTYIKQSSHKRLIDPWRCADRPPPVLISLQRFSHRQQCSTCTAWWRRAAVWVTSGVTPEVRSTNPGKKQLFLHIRLRSIRFPVPPQPPEPGRGGIYREPSAASVFLIRSSACRRDSGPSRLR